MPSSSTARQRWRCAARAHPVPAAVPAWPSIIMLSAQLMIILDMTVVNIALPHIQAGLHFSTAGLSWVLNAYTLTFGGLLLLGGRAGDILGRRRMFLAGIALFTVARRWRGGLATDGLVAARRPRPAGRRRRAGLARGAGPGRGQLPGGPGADPGARHLLRRGHGRRLARPGARRRDHRVGVLALGAVRQRAGRASRCVAVTPLFITESPRQPGRFDLTGALTSIAGMTALVYAFIRAASDGWADRLTLAAFARGRGDARRRSCSPSPGPGSRSRRCGCSPARAGPAPTWPGCCWSRACSGCSSS